jgi:hypothetical protein
MQVLGSLALSGHFQLQNLLANTCLIFVILSIYTKISFIL